MWIRADEGRNTAALERQLRRNAPTGATPPMPERSRRANMETVQQLTEQIAFVDRFSPDAFAGGAQERDELLARLRRDRESIQQNLTTLPTQARPVSMGGAAPDDRFVRGGIQPQRLQIERNSFRTADTCSIVLRYTDAPFDPRLVRACAVEVVLGVVPAEQWQNGMHGSTRASGQLESVVEQVPGGGALDSATRFVGWVDTWKVGFDDTEGDSVVLECRDITAILLDTPLATGSGIDLTKPIDQGVRDFLDSYPTCAGLTVRFGDVWETNPGAAPIPAASIPPQRRARRGRVARHARSGDQKMNLWDHITDVCVQVGLVPIFRDYELRIINPRTLWTSSQAPRRMIYGRNLLSLEFTRKLGGVKVPTVEVRAYDPQIGRTRWARWPTRTGGQATGVIGVTNPPAALRANEVGPSGANPDERIQTFVLRYGNDVAALATAAQSIYEQIGRQEIEGNLSTDDVASWGQPEDAFDMLHLDAGDPVEVLVAIDEDVGTDPLVTAGSIANLSTRARAAYLEALGWEPDVAARFAHLQDAAGFSPIFRVQDVRITYDADDGVGIEADFVNFIEIRNEVDASAADQPRPSEAVSRETAGRGSSAAADLQRVSGVRRLLTVLRDGGAISEDSYQRRLTALAEVERVRRQHVQEGTEPAGGGGGT